MSKVNFKTKFELMNDGTGVLVLFVDDKLSHCPHAPMAYMPTGQFDQNNQPVMMPAHITCKSTCPFFKEASMENTDENGKKIVTDGWAITCMTKMNFIEANVVKGKNSSNLITK